MLRAYRISVSSVLSSFLTHASQSLWRIDSGIREPQPSSHLQQRNPPLLILGLILSFNQLFYAPRMIQNHAWRCERNAVRLKSSHQPSQPRYEAFPASDVHPTPHLHFIRASGDNNKLTLSRMNPLGPRKLVRMFDLALQEPLPLHGSRASCQPLSLTVVVSDLDRRWTSFAFWQLTVSDGHLQGEALMVKLTHSRPRSLLVP